MHVRLVPNAQPVKLIDLTGNCGKQGVILQSLDANGIVFVGTDQLALSAKDAGGNPADGFTLIDSTSITNIPSTIIIAPLAGALYGVNIGAGASIISVTVFPLE